jgi:hypothetical protein
VSLRSLWNGLLRPSQQGPQRIPPLNPESLGSNPVLAWLDAVRLPWRLTRGALAARFGIHADNPYHWELVPLDVRPPPLDGMLWPFCLQAFACYNPAMPPGRLSTHVWLTDDADTNIEHTAAQLAKFLGTRPVDYRYNTRTIMWQSGGASVTLTVWPPAKQSGPQMVNPAHDRDKRLNTACSVTVQTGWRPPLSRQERTWLDGFEPMGPTRNWIPARPGPAFGQGLFAETLLEFTREPPVDLDRFRDAFGLSAGGDALISCEEALYVIPLAQVRAFEVSRTLPAKGGGGSVLSALCETGYAACPTKKLPVAKGAGADDLNAVAATLAAATDKPLTLGDYDYDV